MISKKKLLTILSASIVVPVTVVAVSCATSEERKWNANIGSLTDHKPTDPGTPVASELTKINDLFKITAIKNPNNELITTWISNFNKAFGVIETLGSFNRIDPLSQPVNVDAYIQKSAKNITSKLPLFVENSVKTYPASLLYDIRAKADKTTVILNIYVYKASAKEENMKLQSLEVKLPFVGPQVSAENTEVIAQHNALSIKFNEISVLYKETTENSTLMAKEELKPAVEKLNAEITKAKALLAATSFDAATMKKASEDIEKAIKEFKDAVDNSLTTVEEKLEAFTPSISVNESLLVKKASEIIEDNLEISEVAKLTPEELAKVTRKVSLRAVDALGKLYVTVTYSYNSVDYPKTILLTQEFNKDVETYLINSLLKPFFGKSGAAFDTNQDITEYEKLAKPIYDAILKVQEDTTTSDQDIITLKNNPVGLMLYAIDQANNKKTTAQAINTMLAAADSSSAVRADKILASNYFEPIMNLSRFVKLASLKTTPITGVTEEKLNKLKTFISDFNKKMFTDYLFVQNGTENQNDFGKWSAFEVWFPMKLAELYLVTKDYTTQESSTLLFNALDKIVPEAGKYGSREGSSTGKSGSRLLDTYSHAFRGIFARLVTDFEKGDIEQVLVDFKNFSDSLLNVSKYSWSNIAALANDTKLVGLINKVMVEITNKSADFTKIFNDFNSNSNIKSELTLANMNDASKFAGIYNFVVYSTDAFDLTSLKVQWREFIKTNLIQSNSLDKFTLVKQSDANFATFSSYFDMDAYNEAQENARQKAINDAEAKITEVLAAYSTMDLATIQKAITDTQALIAKVDDETKRGQLTAKITPVIEKRDQIIASSSQLQVVETAVKAAEDEISSTEVTSLEDLISKANIEIAKLDQNERKSFETRVLAVQNRVNALKEFDDLQNGTKALVLKYTQDSNAIEASKLDKSAIQVEGLNSLISTPKVTVKKASDLIGKAIITVEFELSGKTSFSKDVELDTQFKHWNTDKIMRNIIGQFGWSGVYARDVADTNSNNAKLTAAVAKLKNTDAKLESFITNLMLISQDATLSTFEVVYAAEAMTYASKSQTDAIKVAKTQVAAMVDTKTVSNAEKIISSSSQFKHLVNATKLAYANVRLATDVENNNKILELSAKFAYELMEKYLYVPTATNPFVADSRWYALSIHIPARFAEYLIMVDSKFSSEQQTKVTEAMDWYNKIAATKYGLKLKPTYAPLMDKHVDLGMSLMSRLYIDSKLLSFEAFNKDAENIKKFVNGYKTLTSMADVKSFFDVLRKINVINGELAAQKVTENYDFMDIFTKYESTIVTLMTNSSSTPKDVAELGAALYGAFEKNAATKAAIIKLMKEKVTKGKTISDFTGVPASGWIHTFWNNFF